MFKEQADLSERVERVVLLFRFVIRAAATRAARLLSKIVSFAIAIFMLY